MKRFYSFDDLYLCSNKSSKVDFILIGLMKFYDLKRIICHNIKR